MLDPFVMNTESKTFTRRDALLSVLQGTVAAAMVAPVMVQAAPQAAVLTLLPEFVPENDYPFFGAEPDALA